MRVQPKTILVKIVSPLVMATLIAFSGITVAQAHTKLISANPAAASEVSEWPTQITLEFDE
jgi:methionine-rich copper-binding protein CopC